MTFYFPSLSVCWQTTHFLVAFSVGSMEHLLCRCIIHEPQNLLESQRLPPGLETLDCLRGKILKKKKKCFKSEMSRSRGSVSALSIFSQRNQKCICQAQQSKWVIMINLATFELRWLEGSPARVPMGPRVLTDWAMSGGRPSHPAASYFYPKPNTGLPK